MSRRGQDLGVDIVEHGLVLLLELLLRGIPCTLGAEVLHLEANLRGERAVERVVGFDDGVAAQRALAVDVGVAKLLLADGHVLALVGVPELLAPVLAARVEGAAVVEDDSFNAP